MIGSEGGLDGKGGRFGLRTLVLTYQAKLHVIMPPTKRVYII